MGSRPSACVGSRALAGCCVYASAAKDASIARTHLERRRVFCSRTFRMYYIHTGLDFESENLPKAQDTFQSISDLISCAGVTRTGRNYMSYGHITLMSGLK